MTTKEGMKRVGTDMLSGLQRTGVSAHAGGMGSPSEKRWLLRALRFGVMTIGWRVTHSGSEPRGKV